MNNKGKDVTLSIEECLRAWGVSLQDYQDVILALFQAAPKNRAAHVLMKFDRWGNPIPNATVSRDFGGLTILAEDRGAVYAVWVKRTQRDGSLEAVLAFAEFPWGKILPANEGSGK